MSSAKLITVLFSAIFIVVYACPKDCSNSEITRYCGNLNTSSPNYSVLCSITVDRYGYRLSVYCNRNDNITDRVFYTYGLDASHCTSSQVQDSNGNSDAEAKNMLIIVFVIIFIAALACLGFGCCL